MEVVNVSGYAINPQVCDVGTDRLCALLYVFLASLTAATIVGNLLVIVAVFYFKQLHTPTNLLILSLAVADLLIGILVLPFNISFSVTACGFVNTSLCKVRTSFDFTLSMSSVLNLCCISIDRYNAVCYPLAYSSRITDRSAVAMSVGSWASSAAVGVCHLSMSFYYQECGAECFTLLMMVSLFTFYLPIVVLIVVYCKIFVVAQAQARRLKGEPGRTGAASGGGEKKATKTMAVVMGLFLLCWLPLFVLYPVQYVDDVTLMLFEPFNWFAMSNSMFNPFVYAFFYKWFRSAVHMIVSGKILRGDLAHAKLR